MTRFKVEGMCCAEETAILRDAVGDLVGDPDLLRFDIINGVMRVGKELSGEEVDKIVERVAATGMTASPLDPKARSGGASRSERRRVGRAILTAASGVLALLGWIMHVTEFSTGSYVAYAGAVLAGMWVVFPRALYALRTFRPDMNLLMTIAVAGALIIDEWFEAATISCLFALSLLLESWSIGRARRAIAALMELAPIIARRKDPDGGFAEVEPEEIVIGDMLLVHPGEKFPVDGRVASGHGMVDQAPITGESIPVAKSFGDRVYAGTTSLDGALEIVAVRPAGESTFAHIVQMVEEAGSRRSRSERWVEKFARIYTPAILGVAFLTFLLPPLLFGGVWDEWTYRALVILVIGCPCALVISTPVTIVAGLAAAAKQGVLVKGGEFLELPARVRAIAFDKTGTLTQGVPVVTSVIPLNGHDERELLERAAAMEANSSHPLARAVVRRAEELGLRPMRAESFRTIEGKGAVAEFRGRQYWLGSRAYLAERRQSTPEAERHAAELADAGASVVAIGSEDHVCGLIGITDTVRREAAATVSELRGFGIDTAMLTGDNRATAASIAEKTGVANVYSELLPKQKVDVVEDLVKNYEIVAMVGDGVNDAPAMARSSLGIAMGAAGTDVALETADIALMSDELHKIPWLIRHSRRTLNIIRQNVAFAIGIKLFFFGATLAGFATLWCAIAADIGATLLVTGNALRLLRSRN